MIAAALTADPGDRRTLGALGRPRRHERTIASSGMMVQETGLTFGQLAPATASAHRPARTRQRRHGPAGVEQPRLRIRHRLHRDVQEGTWNDTNALLRHLTGWGRHCANRSPEALFGSSSRAWDLYRRCECI